MVSLSTFTTFRNLPLAIIIGIPVVGVCYLLVNVAFFAGLSRFEIMNTSATALVRNRELILERECVN